MLSIFLEKIVVFDPERSDSLIQQIVNDIIIPNHIEPMLEQARNMAGKIALIIVASKHFV
jgi:hypothetical protein